MAQEKRKLVVGDELVLVKKNRYSKFKEYIFAKVERLTKTQAILDNGDKVINEPIQYTFGYSQHPIQYSIYGDRWTKYQLSTDEIKQEAIQEKNKREIYNWYNDNKDGFTEEQITEIYNLFNN